MKQSTDTKIPKNSKNENLDKDKESLGQDSQEGKKQELLIHPQTLLLTSIIC